MDDLQTPRNAWEAMTLAPLRLIRSAWPWRSASYVVTGAVLGILVGSITFFVVAVVVLYAPWLAPVVLVAVPLAAGPLGRCERTRLRLVDFDLAQSARRAGRTPATNRHWHERVTDPALWRETAYFVLLATLLWAVDLVAVLVLLVLPLVCASSVVWVWFADESPLLIAFLFPGGVGLLLVSGMMVCAYAGFRAQSARALLSPGPSGMQRQVQELTQSRSRMAAAFEAERHRIERDLHDGAQQRLTALSVALAMARLDLPVDSPATEHLIRAQHLATLAHSELRELVHDIHPQVLTDHGLSVALVELADRAALPTVTDTVLPVRLPESVEVAAYFAVSEALTNAVRHSGATRVQVQARHDGAQLAVQVSDNGHGGADPSRGTGLTGLADRLAVLEGTLILDSPPGGPTTVTLEVPCTVADR